MKEIYTIDMDKIRECLPSRAIVNLQHFRRTHKAPNIKILCSRPQSESEVDASKNAIRKIIPKEAFNQFYTEETGHEWYIYFKRVPLEFINCENNDIKSYIETSL